MELWDIYDSHGKPTGRTIVRGEPLKAGDYHLVVHAWVIDDKGRFLVQKRADNVKLFPGVWATTGGSALSGEASMAAAMRELREEMGVVAEPAELAKICRIKRSDNLLDIWLVRKNVHLESLKLQEEEVSAAKLIDLETLLTEVRVGNFFDYGGKYLSLIISELSK